LILEEDKKLYNELTTELTISVIAASAAMSISSLPQPDNNRQKLTHKNDEIEE
jgi:hypothetical protein